MIGRVRAVLSWGTPPSTTDPDAMPHWGNRLDVHVQLRPGTPYDGTARFNIVGGVAAASVNMATGLTLPGASLAVNGSPLPYRTARSRAWSRSTARSTRPSPAARTGSGCAT